VSIAVAIIGLYCNGDRRSHFAFLWALLIFALNFIPYVGPLISTLLPAAFSIFYIRDDLAIFMDLPCIEAFICFCHYVEPKVMGNYISPLVVLIALASGICLGIVRNAFIRSLRRSC